MSLESVVAQLKSVAKRPYLVGIDGRSGSGKSFLAQQLREQLSEIAFVHKDMFFRVMDESERAKLNDAEPVFNSYFDWQRLERDVLSPLKRGQSARYQRYDWVRNKLSETIEVSPQHMVVVEGIGSTRPELRDSYDFRVWVETSDDERIRRQLARGATPLEWIKRWAADEAYFFETFTPSLFAHAIVCGDSSRSAG